METTNTRTINDLTFNGDAAVLLSYANGERALWVIDEYLAGGAGGYSLNDISSKVGIGPFDDIDGLIADWKAAVEWDDEAD